MVATTGQPTIVRSTMKQRRDHFEWFVIISVIAVILWVYIYSSVNGQQPLPPSPEVEWREAGDGWLLIDQIGSGAVVIVHRASISAISAVQKGSSYAETVYRDPYDLVILQVGAREWRVRCPDAETATELAKFITEYKDDGER